MRQIVVWTLMAVLVGGVAFADHFATKADYRAGRLTPGASVTKDGSDSCASAPVVSNTPFNDTGNTGSATDTVTTIPGVCNGQWTQVAGADHIYEFTATAGNMNLTFNVSTTTASYDPSIYVLSICNDGTTCINGADNCLATAEPSVPPSCLGGGSTEEFSLPGLSPGTYWFYVDSFYVPEDPNGTGDYTLTVTGTLPVELIEFEVD